MNDFNPDALVAWLFAMSCGYLLGGTTGIAAGLAIITGIQILVAVFAMNQKRK